MLKNLRLSLPPGEGAPAPKGWRLGLLLALPVPAFALLIGLALEHPSGQATPFDLAVYPALAALLLALDVLLYLRVWSFERVFRVTMGAASAFFIGKLVYILYFLPPTADFFRELSESFFWVPAIYVLSSLLPRIRGGRAVALTCLSSMVAISLVYAVPNLLAGENYGEVYALSQLVLANVTFYVLTQLFSLYMERFIRSQTHAQTMERLAYTDLLTGLPNRLALENELKRLLFADDPLEPHPLPDKLALLFIDIDGFKLVNDTMGHEAGDTLLVLIAQRLRTYSRQGDLLARMSGDEYVLVLHNVRCGDEAVRVAEALKLALDEPFFIEGQVVSVSASIGVSVYPEDARNNFV